MRWALLVIALSVLHAPSLQAQNGFPVGPAGYQSTPTLSPYLGLLRADSGPLPNYQQFVRPRLRLQNAIAQQSRAIQRQDTSIRALTQQLNRPAPRDGRRRAARFLNYSTFYPGLPQR